MLDGEPPASGHPLLPPDLTRLLATPHTAWAAVEARQRALGELAANVADLLAGGRAARPGGLSRLR